jgi:hypothetical protein
VQACQAAGVAVELGLGPCELLLQHVGEPLGEDGVGCELGEDEGVDLRGHKGAICDLLEDDAEKGGELLLLKQNGIDLVFERTVDAFGRGVGIAQ